MRIRRLAVLLAARCQEKPFLKGCKAFLKWSDPGTKRACNVQSTVHYALADAYGGTDVFAMHDGLPPGLDPADNEAGWRLSLGKLAALVESRA